MATTDVVNSIMSTLSIVNEPSAEKVEEKIEKKVEEKIDYFETEFASETVEKLYLNEEMVDFHFTFDSGDRVPAHKFLLSGSDVFRTLFEGEWKGKSEAKLTSTSITAFKEFLQFFYMREAKLSMEHIAEVMRLCKRYNVTKCSTVCGKFLKPQLNDDNVCWAYDLAIMCDEKELKAFCERIIGYNATAVFASESFKTCSRDVISNLLEMNEMMCCPEVELFEASMTWVKCVSKQEQLTKEIIKDKLGDLFYKIRFGSMPLKDVSRIIVSYGSLFSTDEYKTMMQMTMPGEMHDQLFCEARQKSSKAVTWKDTDLILCGRYGSYKTSLAAENRSPYLVKDVETTTFSSDTPLMLAGFQPAFLEEDGKRYCSIKEDIPTEVTIIEIDPSDCSEKVVLPKEKSVILSKPPRSVSFSKLIFIKPKFMYKIRLEPSPKEKCSVREFNKSKVNLLQGKATVEFFDETIEHEDETGKYSRGLVQGLQFIDSHDTPSADKNRLNDSVFN